MNHDTRCGGNIAKRDKKGKGNDEVDKSTPEPTGRPVVFLAGIVVLFIGLFIAMGSLIHNNLKFFVNSTSHAVFGPWDWAAAIVGAITLLVGIILLMVSRSTSRSSR